MQALVGVDVEPAISGQSRRRVLRADGLAGCPRRHIAAIPLGRSTNSPESSARGFQIFVFVGDSRPMGEAHAPNSIVAVCMV